MTNVEKHHAILEEIGTLYAKKNSDYGNSVHDTYMKYGPVSFIVRMEDKLNRIAALTLGGNGQQVMDERVIDTITDLANYAIIMRVEMEQEMEALTHGNKDSKVGRRLVRNKKSM